MKKFIVILVLAVLVVGGFYAFKTTSDESVSFGSDMEVTDLVDTLDFSKAVRAFDDSFDGIHDYLTYSVGSSWYYDDQGDPELVYNFEKIDPITFSDVIDDVNEAKEELKKLYDYDFNSKKAGDNFDKWLDDYIEVIDNYLDKAQAIVSVVDTDDRTVLKDFDYTWPYEKALDDAHSQYYDVQHRLDDLDYNYYIGPLSKYSGEVVFEAIAEDHGASEYGYIVSLYDAEIVDGEFDDILLEGSGFFGGGSIESGDRLKITIDTKPYSEEEMEKIMYNGDGLDFLFTSLFVNADFGFEILEIETVR